MPLTKERDTIRRDSQIVVYPVAASSKIFQGALVVLSGGYAAPGSTATGLIAVGRAEATADNSAGSAGDLTIPVLRGTFLFKNSSTDAVLLTNLGADCFVVDDETVARTSGTGTRSVAGKVRGVEASGIWVEI
jgi:hypothetical protein